MRWIGRWWQRPEPWLVIALGLCVGCFAWGYVLFNAGVPIARPAHGTGNVAWFVREGSAPTSASAVLALGPAAVNETTGNRELGLREKQLQVSLGFRRGTQQVDWALVLDGDYAMPAETPLVGDLFAAEYRFEQPHLGVRPPRLETVDHLWAWWIADINLSAAFSEDAQGAPRLDLDVPRVSVLTGSFQPRIDAIGPPRIELSVPTGAVLLYDLGDSFVLNLPRFGASPDLPGSAQTDDEPRALLEDRLGLDDVPAEVLSALEAKGWRRAREIGWDFTLRQGEIGQRIDSAVPAPRSPSQWVWSGSDQLEVDVAIVQDSRRIARQSNQFFAGIVIGLGGGFLVWVFELLRETIRRERRAGPG